MFAASNILILLLITTVSAYFCLYWRKQIRRYASIDKYPGPSIGTLFKLFFSFDDYDTYHFAINMNKLYGSVVKIWIKPFQPALQVSNVEFFEKILVSKEHLRKSSTYEILRPLMEDGIITIKTVDEWRTDRKSINPGFRPNSVEKYLPILEFHLTTYINLMEKQINKVVDLQESMHLLLLDIIYHTLSGQNFNFQLDGNRSIIDARIKYFDITGKRMYSPILQNEFIFKLTKYYKELMTVLATMHTFSKNVVTNNKLKSNKKEQYVLDFLASIGLSEDKIKNNFDSFITAGEDTSAVTSCFTLYELSKRPEVQQKVLDEIESTLARYNGNITVSAIDEMRYLDSVVKETMRIDTVAPIIERITGKDVEIDGVIIPKDTKIIFNIQQLHKNEEYFENAETFDPERFLPENVHKIRKYAYAPFSLGPRDCIGKHFARLVTRYLVIRILRHFEILPGQDGHSMEIMNKLVVTSRNGIPVIFKRRRTKKL